MTFVKGIFVVIVVSCCHLFLFTILHLLAKSWPNLVKSCSLNILERSLDTFGSFSFRFIPSLLFDPIFRNSSSSSLSGCYSLVVVAVASFVNAEPLVEPQLALYIQLTLHGVSWIFMELLLCFYHLLYSFIFFYILLSFSTTCHF